MTMKIERIAPDVIEVGYRLRRLDKERVAELKEGGWLDGPAQALAERRTDEPNIPASLDRRAATDIGNDV